MVPNIKTHYKTYIKDGVKYDRVERSLKYRLIRRNLENEVEAEYQRYVEYKKSYGCPEPWIGRCHIYWWIKKDILKEKYHIDWCSPAELNPRARFD